MPVARTLARRCSAGSRPRGTRFPRRRGEPPPQLEAIGEDPQDDGRMDHGQCRPGAGHRPQVGVRAGGRHHRRGHHGDRPSQEGSRPSQSGASGCGTTLSSRPSSHLERVRLSHAGIRAHSCRRSGTSRRVGEGRCGEDVRRGRPGRADQGRTSEDPENIGVQISMSIVGVQAVKNAINGIGGSMSAAQRQARRVPRQRAARTSGGWPDVGWREGPELVNLPRGSQVILSAQSAAIASGGMPSRSRSSTLTER